MVSFLQLKYQDTIQLIYLCKLYLIFSFTK